MISYLLKRLVMTVLVIVIVMTFLSLLVHLVPGDPVKIILGPRANPHLAREVRQEMGLDDPIYLQVWNFLAGAAHGDLGEDFLSNEPVTGLILEALPHTAILAFSALGLTALVGIPLGVYAATKLNTAIDRITALLSISFISTPSYVVGLYLLLLFALKWAFFPAAGSGSLSQPIGYLGHLVLPASALAIVWIGYIARLVRTSMLEVSGANYIRTAHAFGLRQGIIYYKYALKNAVIPAVAVLTLAFGELMGSAVFVEIIFSRPGLGRLIVEAIGERNFPIVRGVVLVIALTYILAHLVADLSYRLLDPRIRLEEEPEA
jgi:peptide/nickel transport system permease protein